MKFLIVTNHSYMFWRFRRELTSELLKRGEVVISTPFVGHEDDLQSMGCRCVQTTLERRSLNPRKEIALFAFYHKLLREEKPDLVITYSIKPNIYAGYACRLLHIPYFVNVQGLGSIFQRESTAKIASLLYRMAVKEAQAVFFENQSSAEVFARRGIVPKQKEIILSGAGINLNEYSCQPYPSEENGIHFLYLGRIMQEKGIDEILEASQRLKQEYGNRVFIDFVGFFEDDYKDRIDLLVKRNVIRFHGFCSDPRPFYAQAHCIVLPSYHEGMSNVLLEAASIGRALITSDIPGCREAVSDGETGFLVPVKDSEALYQAMKHFLELSPEKRRLMGERSRLKMETEFDKEQVVDETLAAMQL